MSLRGRGREARNGLVGEADARTRTADPFITSEVLYQLSYVGGLQRADTESSAGALPQ